MDKGNQPLITDKPVKFENNQMKFKSSGKLPIIVEKSMEHVSNYTLTSLMWLFLLYPKTLGKNVLN